MKTGIGNSVTDPAPIAGAAVAPRVAGEDGPIATGAATRVGSACSFAIELPWLSSLGSRS